MWDDLPVVFTLAKADVQKLRRPLDELRDPRLTSADRAAVREILLRQPPEGLLHFVKDAGVWKFGDSAPPFELDGAAVDELLAAIFETRADDYIPADAEKLGQPAAVITLALTGSEQTEKMALYHAEDDRFISVRGSESTGYIIDAESLEPIFRSAIGYRDRTVWDIDGESVAELRLTRGGEQAADYHITRDEAGAWKLEGYDRGAVEALLQRIAPLMADGWIVDPPATAPEGITIELTLKDGATKKATLDPGSHLAVAADVQGVFRVREDVSQSAMAELRDRVVIKTELGEIATVRLGDASIARDRNGLYQIEGDEQLTEQKAAGIFDALAGLTVERYLPPHDRGQPTHRLTFATRDGQEQTLALWAPGPDSPSAPWIGRLGEGGYFSLSHEAAQGLTATGDVPPPPDK
jgi:hypothetical protein